MKDAKGHGSDAHGGQTAVANWRSAHPPVAHQAGIMQKLPGLVKSFAQNESGLGKTLMEAAEEAEAFLQSHDPESASRFVGDAAHTLTGGDHLAKTLLHLAHYLGMLGALAIVDLLAHAAGLT